VSPWPRGGTSASNTPRAFSTFPSTSRAGADLKSATDKEGRESTLFVNRPYNRSSNYGRVVRRSSLLYMENYSIH